MNTPRSWKGMVLIATSLDGYIARADGDIAWLTDPPPNADHVPPHTGPNPPPSYDRFVEQIDHLVFGRGTYEKVLTFDDWPYAKFEVIVLSTSLPADHDARITVARTVEEVTRLLDDRKARGVYIDGGRTIQSLLRHGLIDELNISVAPVLLGGGLPLFGELDDDVRLTHLGTSTGSGMTTSRYAVAGTIG